MIVLFLSGMVAMILMRTLHKDIARYNQIDSGEDAQVKQIFEWWANQFFSYKKEKVVCNGFICKKNVKVTKNLRQ